MYEDQVFPNNTGKEGFNLAAKLGLTNAQVNAATTVEGLKTAVRAIPGHEDEKAAKERICRGLDQLKATGDYSDADENAATTVAAARAGMGNGDTQYGTRLPGE